MTPTDLVFFLDPHRVSPLIAGLGWLVLAWLSAALVARASDQFGGAL